MSQTQTASERSISKGIDIAFIVIGLAVFLGLGAFFLKGVIAHIEYLTADDKLTVTAKYVNVTVKRGKAKMDSEGNVTSDEMYDITYEYCIDDQPHTYVRKNRSTYNQKDVKLRLYRNSSEEEYRETDMYGMWAGVQWFLLALSAYIGIKLILFGGKSLRNGSRLPGDNPEEENKPDAAPPQT
ncbi:MAG: hypothetical protein IKI58_09285 [Oscillospiraceae bacterium]|nr:hypothetical protein [Oscillospiraceae bacterium]